MHVRAYNYWVSLLDGPRFPSIEDLEPGDVEDFAANSVLLDFTCSRDNPAIPYVGAAIREECALDDDMRTIDDVPSRSLLSRLTDHYMQIIANRSPVGFEAEFENPRGETICYRGILMPFSSDGDAIDFIYGVINWKRVDERLRCRSAAGIRADEIAGLTTPVELDDEVMQSADEPLELTEIVSGDAMRREAGSPSLKSQPEMARLPPCISPGKTGRSTTTRMSPTIVLDDNAGLADRLWAARETAETVKAGEGRTRAALYKALSLAYDFAVAAQRAPTNMPSCSRNRE